MSYKKALTIQDISCVGQCSMTVALPIISACGHETAILPSAVLSTHTCGFSGFTVRDLADDMPAINEHWVKENIKFDAFCTGYLGSKEQVDYVKNIMATTGAEGCVKVIDPAMADHGKLYPAFDMEYVNAMKKLCDGADILLPNITEAAFLTDTEYKEDYDEAYINDLMVKLQKMGSKTVVITGVSYNEGKTGIAIRENGENKYYEHERMEKSFHGTGDIYTAAFTGALLCGKDVFDSVKIAADYTLECMKKTADDPDHWYGVKFEKALPQLIKSLNL